MSAQLSEDMESLFTNGLERHARRRAFPAS